MEENPQDKAKPKGRPLRARCLRWLFWLTLGCILALVTAWALLQTRWAKDRLAALAASATADLNGCRLTLEGVDGCLPFSILIDRMTLSDAKGVWLDGRRVDISLKPTALLAGLLDVEWFRVGSLSVSRTPDPAGALSESAPAGQGRRPHVLPRVMIRDIRIDRIDLAQEVTGAPLAYRLQSTARTEGPNIEIRALIEDLDHPADVLRLSAEYDLQNDRMRADLTYRESKGGLAARLMGLSDAAGIGFQLEAEGPLSGIKGRLDLEIGDYGDADLNVEAGIDDPLTLTICGQIRAGHRIIPESVMAAIGGPNIDIECRADISSGKTIRIKAFTARTLGGAVSVEGTADLANGLLDMEAMVSSLNILPFLGESGLEHQALGPVRVTAKGPFEQLEVTAAATLGALRAQGATLKEITLTAGAAFEKGWRGLGKIYAALTAKHLEVPQVPGLTGPLRVDAAAASPDFRKWAVERLRVTAGGVVVSAQDTRIDTVSGAFTGNLLARIDRLAVVLPAGAGNVEGESILHAHADGNYATGQIAADLHMELSRLSDLPVVAAEAVGPALTLDAHAAIKDGVLRLEKARVTGDHAELNACGGMNTRDGSFDVEYRLVLRNLAGMTESMSTKVSGDMEGRGRISGNFEEFAADAVASSEKLAVNELDLKNLHGRLELKGLPGRPEGSLSVKGAALEHPLRLDAGGVWSSGTLSLSGVKAALPGIDMHADLRIEPLKRRFSGTAEGKLASMELLSALTGIPAEGRGGFHLEAGASAQGGGMTLNGDLKDLRCQGHRVGSLRISATIDDMEVFRGQVSVEGTDAAFRDVQMNTFTLDARGDLAKAAGSMEARGSIMDRGAHGRGPSRSPLSLSARLHMDHSDIWRFRLEQFDVLHRRLDVRLACPARLSIEGPVIRLDDLNLLMAGGSLQAQGQLDREAVQASVRTIDLPLAFLGTFLDQDLSGTVSAECVVSGPLTGPAVHAEAHVRDCRFSRGGEMPPLILGAELEAERRKDRFEASLSVTGLDRTPFTVRGSLPARLSLAPFALELERDGEMTGTLKGRIDLTAFRGLPVLGDQILSGGVRVDIGLGGPVEKWALNGGIDIQNGHYQNPASGTILADIDAHIDANGRTLRLSRLTASDGEAGTVVLEGEISTEAPFLMDARLTFNQATLVRKKILTATAGGTVKAKGAAARRLDLTGEIVFDRTELSIPRRLPPDVVVIPVTEINLPPDMATGNPAPLEDSRLLFMDLSLQIPARFFVRGRGLDAEFKGQLTANGPADNPVIRGTLQVVRGTFQFLTRTFHITSGEIAFDGARPPVPFLNITTQVSAGQIDALVRVTGPADNFRVTLTSQPPLPQDEIMANILFGQSVAKLNAFQAYQLAASLSQLSGSGNPDIAGAARKTLGLDRLSISGGDTGKTSDRGPTVSAGKYVSEDVYVGIEQELTDAKQDVVVEVDITPRFSVESKAGTRSGAGIGFNWKYDY